MSDAGRESCFVADVARRKRWWGFDEDERRVLDDATAGIPQLRAIVERAQRRAEFNGLWVVEATVKELDDMYTLVQALTDGTRSRRKLDVLEGMLASLCTSIDGF